MQGRNGVDQFARFTMGVALAAIVLTLFTGTRSGIGSSFASLSGNGLLTYLSSEDTSDSPDNVWKYFWKKS